jgi:hypothetical protein
MLLNIKGMHGYQCLNNLMNRRLGDRQDLDHWKCFCMERYVVHV